MTSPPRPLPTVVGRTENALRALLRGTLAGSDLRGYEEWAALNLVNGRAATDDVVTLVSESVAVSRERAVLLLDGMVHRGLLGQESGEYGMSHDGSALLAALRPRVVETTRRLLEGLSPQDVEIAVRVLDQVRARADRELADLTR